MKIMRSAISIFATIILVLFFSFVWYVFELEDYSAPYTKLNTCLSSSSAILHEESRSYRASCVAIYENSLSDIKHPFFFSPFIPKIHSYELDPTNAFAILFDGQLNYSYFCDTQTLTEYWVRPQRPICLTFPGANGTEEVYITGQVEHLNDIEYLVRYRLEMVLFTGTEEPYFEIRLFPVEYLVDGVTKYLFDETGTLVDVCVLEGEFNCDEGALTVLLQNYAPTPRALQVLYSSK